ncbi:tripartite motif containing 101 [Epinephelus lanceolatus]
MTERNYPPTVINHQQMESKEELKFGGAAMSLPADLSCLQGGGGAEALATLEKQLICPICLELFNKPVVILPCQHNLCRKCANELYQPSLFQARTTMMVNSGRFRCPSCRHEVVLDRHGVYGLQRNLLVENIIDVYKQEVSNNNNASSPLPLPPSPAQLTCSNHEGEKVNIYCLTCQVPTCSLCKVFGAHQTCQVAPLTDVHQQKKDELSEGISSLVAFNDKVQALIDGLEETCRTIEENCKTQKQSVCETFDRVFSILEERQKAMTQRISSEEEEKTGHAQTLVRCYGESVEANNKLVERATSSMEEPDMAAFVQNSRELIKKVITATGSCPAATLKPGYESLSHYRFNFSRQERALRSIDFPKVVEDVPEEPEVEQEPEEPKEPSVENIDPKHHQETSTQNLESVSEPVKEPIPVLVSSPVEPAAVTPAPGVVRDSVEPAGAVLLPETEDLDLDDRGSSVMKNKTEKEEEEEEEEEEAEEEEEVEEERCAAPVPVKEGNICEEQEGMSTQQCEAVGDAGDRTAQTETEDKQKAQDEEEEMMKEEINAMFYPSWYKPSSWRRMSPDPADILTKVCDAEQTTCSQPAGESLSEAAVQTETGGAVQVVSEAQVQPEPTGSLEPNPSEPPPGPQELHTQTETQPLSDVPIELGSASTPAPQTQAVGEVGVTEQENDEEEMQDWVCLPGAVDKSFSLVEGSFDLGDSLSDNNDSPSSVAPEEAEGESLEVNKEKFESSDERVEDAEEKEVNLDLKCASELKDREGELEAEAMKGGLEEGSMKSDRKEKDASVREDGSEPKSDSLGVGSIESLTEGGGDAEFEAGSSEFAGKKEKNGENSEQPEDLMEMRFAEAEENISSSVSLQAVTLLFYLLAFLVILQRVWAYIGCFICT